MPELPEVETIVRELQEAKIVGKKITRAHVFWERTIVKPVPAVFSKEIQGQTILGISRRAKYIVISLSSSTLLVHLRTTGKFLISPSEEVQPHERVRLYLSDGRILHYEDQRKFGKWDLVTDPANVLSHLGIEPLSADFTLQAFQALLKEHNRQIKPFLLDQRYLVGLGNIYVDEALWEAKIHPLRLSHLLSNAEITALYQAIPQVLQKGIDNTGTTLGDKSANYFSIHGRRGTNQHQLNVFRREGLKCPRCHSILIKTVVAQRGTHLCPVCQKP